MPTEVLYRKWRPQRFSDVSGQELLTRTLVNAVASRKVSHAYLFSGPRGTGKTTTARLLAKAINCEMNAPGATASDGEPCSECASCRSFGTGSALDLIEMDGASNRGIDDIRKLREQTNYMAMGGAEAHKVYLIDEVHMLTEAAFNALLKTLEEPPAHVVFILATTDAHKMPATIVSRCQRHEFKRIPLSAIVDRLAFIAGEESIRIPREGMELIAREATGSLRDAINLLEQICDSFGKDASIEAVREGLGLVGDERAAALAVQALHGDLAAGIETIGAVRDDGLDLRQFQKEVVLRLREMLIVQSGADTDKAWTPEQVATMRQGIEGVPTATLVRALRAFGQADLRVDPLSPLPLELALADTAMPPVPVEAAAATSRPAAAPARPQAPQQRYAAPPHPAANAPAPTRQPEPPAAPAERVPASMSRVLSNQSAEDIAAMVGSKAPVIPPASEQPAEEAVAVTAENGGVHAAIEPLPGVGTATGGVDLAALLLDLRARARERSVKLDALLNGSCAALSWQDGVLTLGFFEDKFHKKGVEEAQNKRVYEELASQILGAPVSIRCIIAPRPARPLATSPLVQHAVQNLGAKIVGEDQEL
ncbi:MAG: DNA polymerase III subunit gamma/tau [Chloroflexi bacterium]|nr:DNA polymerase III subunit gamma/tau [Chloroflexota bacterium]